MVAIWSFTARCHYNPTHWTFNNNKYNITFVHFIFMTCVSFKDVISACSRFKSGDALTVPVNPYTLAVLCWIGMQVHTHSTLQRSLYGPKHCISQYMCVCLYVLICTVCVRRRASPNVCVVVVCVYVCVCCADEWTSCCWLRGSSLN